MGGKVIQALRISRLANVLREADMQVLANCGDVQRYAPGETILCGDGQDEHVFVLWQGQVQLRVTMWSEGGHCGGEACQDLTYPGDVFGWAFWVRSDKITIFAQAMEPSTIIRLNLDRLKDSQTFQVVSQRMIQILYGSLQEGGICPPNVQGILYFKNKVIHA